MKKFIRGFLFYIGWGDCCDDPNLQENVMNQYYFEYECLNCDRIRRGVLGR